MSKRLKKILAIILSSAIILSTASMLGISASAYYSNSDYLYEIENGKAIIIGFQNEPEGNVVIPDTIDGYPVGRLECAFSNNNNITSITIGDCDVIMDSWAFDHCENLRSVTISNGDVILYDSWAFNKCPALESISIGDGDVVIYGGWVFNECTNLRTITIGNGDVVLGEGWGFTNCQNLENITTGDGTLYISKYSIENTPFYKNPDNWIDGALYIGNHLIAAKQDITECKIREGTLSIASSAFAQCNMLRSVDIPNSVTSIGSNAFADCTSLNSIELPEKLICIGKYAFAGCAGIAEFNISAGVMTIGEYAFIECNGLIRITVDEENEFFSADEYGVLFNKNKTELIKYPAANLRETYTVPEGVTTIGNSAFRSSDNLVKVSLSDTIRTIENAAFYSSSNLKSVNIPENTEYIGEEAFYNCEALTEITIPESVTELSSYAFSYCEKLNSITLHDNIKIIGSNVFTASGYYNAPENWEDGVLYIGNYLVSSHYSLKECEIREGTKIIANSAFESSYELESVTIPDSVEYIGMNAFTSTSFYNDDSNWTNDTLYIGNYLISSNIVEDELRVREGTTVITEHAFWSASITKLYIPESVKSLPEIVGGKTANIVDTNNEYFTSDDYGILFNKDKTELLSYPIDAPRTAYKMPDSVEKIGAYAFRNSNLTDIEFSENLKTIDKYAFAYCDDILNMTLPEKVTVIGERAFDSCMKLSTMTFKSESITIGDYAFDECYSLENIVFPENTTLGTNAFSMSSDLRKIVLSNSQTEISERTFALCYALKNLYIPATVTKINEYAFFGCSSLTDIYFAGSEEEWNNIAVECGNSKLSSVTVHFSSNIEDIPEIPEDLPPEPEDPPIEPEDPPIEPEDPPEGPNVPPIEGPDMPPPESDDPIDPDIPPYAPEIPPEEPDDPPVVPEDPVKPDNGFRPNKGSGIKETEHGIEIKPGMRPSDVQNGTDNDVTIHKPDGSLVDAGSFVGTGCIIKITDTEGNVIEEYEVLVDSDVTGDGKITASDARAALRSSASIKVLNGIYVVAADTNGDGRVNASDARVILRRSAGLDESISTPDEDAFDRMEELLSCTFGSGFNYENADTGYVIDCMIRDYFFIGTYNYYFGESETGADFSDPLGRFYCHYKTPVENIKWICENIYQVKFDENYESVTNKSYYYDGYVYIDYGQAGYGCVFDTEIENWVKIDNGKYKINAKTYACDFDPDSYSKTLNYVYEVVAEWKKIDGKFDWVFSTIEAEDVNIF